MTRNHIYQTDCIEGLKMLPAESVNCCVTSPPYWGLRDYGVAGQFGLEKTPEEYVARMVEVFREVRRVLRSDGTLWLNLGDSYAGSMKGEGGTYELSAKQNSNRGSHYGKDSGEKTKFNHGLKPKDLVGIPWRVAFALQSDGWYLRQDIIWAKPNPMPESVTDRCTKSHEYVFLLSKSAKYYYDNEAIKEPMAETSIPHMKYPRYASGSKGDTGIYAVVNKEYNGEDMRNRRSVWTVTTKPFKGAHFATFPEKLIEPCILAGCPVGGVVLDPFMGAGTTALVAMKNDRRYVGFELNPAYIEIAEKRLEAERDKRGLFRDAVNQ